MKVKAVVAYDGSEFQGFQIQTKTNNTVAFHIQRALKQVGIESKINASGRTDAKVHATGQVIDFELPNFWQDRDLKELKSHINSKLDAINFKHITKVDDNFHSRYSAKERVYRYIFRANPSIFERRYISRLSIIDDTLLAKALECFVGRFDFGAFKRVGSQTKSDIREIKRAYYIKRGEYYYIYFHADGFLRSQVRLMVSASVSVANRDLSISKLQEQLYKKVPHIRKPAPPEGLYLARVIY